jgi:hypothetical protein
VATDGTTDLFAFTCPCSRGPLRSRVAYVPLLSRGSGHRLFATGLAPWKASPATLLPFFALQPAKQAQVLDKSITLATVAVVISGHGSALPTSVALHTCVIIAP